MKTSHSRLGAYAKRQLGVQSPWTIFAFISKPDAALDFKQYIGGIYLAGVLVEVQAARDLAAIYTLTQAA